MIVQNKIGSVQLLSVMYEALCDPTGCGHGLSAPWNFPGMNTGVRLPFPPQDLPDPGLNP